MLKKREYHYIELWKRKEIIEWFQSKKESIKKCSQRLGIKYITAKHIVKIYKKTGKIETKIMRQSQRKSIEQQIYESNLWEHNYADDKYSNFTPKTGISMLTEINNDQCIIDTNDFWAWSQQINPINWIDYYDPNYWTIILPKSSEFRVEQMTISDMFQKGVVLIPNHIMPSYFDTQPCDNISNILSESIFKKYAN